MINAIQKSNNFSFNGSKKEQSANKDNFSAVINDHYSQYNGMKISLTKDEFDKYQAGVNESNKTATKGALVGFGLGVVASIIMKKCFGNTHLNNDTPLAGTQFLTTFVSTMLGIIVGSEIGYNNNRETIDIPKNKAEKMFG